MLSPLLEFPASIGRGDGEAVGGGGARGAGGRGGEGDVRVEGEAGD